jgi:DNA polymerase delta subunit 1
MKDFFFCSKAYGQHESKETILHGRLQLNVLQNLVCAHFLDGQKENMHHSVITELQEGTPDLQWWLAVYCLKAKHLSIRNQEIDWTY